ncbi:PREDICTED: uncharacterized protein LOC108764129, partial [Trachymyrmex cornetzi]|uniref:uncharacterized protein LOC108764129 n=1 Tax=Trachymyrmex cornetzi TaxID=471704 RepID=UPI00084F7561
MRAGCHVEVPREIATKRAVISVRTADNACFAWSVVAVLYPAERNVRRESSYPHYKAVLNFTNIEFPMILKDIQKFEQLNDISINVYNIENKRVLPVRLTSDKKEKHINVLYLQDSRNDGVGHFAWIKNLSRLVSSQLSKKEHKKFFCDRCLHYFSTSKKLELHAMDCRKINDCAIRLPSEDDKWLEFDNHRNKERIPIVVYADLECVLQKTESDKEDASYTYQRHKSEDVRGEGRWQKGHQKSERCKEYSSSSTEVEFDNENSREEELHDNDNNEVDNFEDDDGSPKLLSQSSLNDLVRELDLPKDKAELLGSRLKERNLLQPDVTFCCFFPQNLGDVNEEQGERFHQDIKNMER